jgi:hypothetical protein
MAAAIAAGGSVPLLSLGAQPLRQRMGARVADHEQLLAGLHAQAVAHHRLHSSIDVGHRLVD